ncbi:MAG: histidine kinase [Bdellovibrio sp. ArHS]|uniref:ATP-binding protein n=1 Tax=Bdellovibrio sp. ArHS TaxID=1569284 RepID=UPI0005824EAF|nr:ATP-binding protein [Bdellovibrio sp. ArHS]KHD89045.1 MAG: histidine kinase [Bdellovibrio sp. ArHS]
MTHKTRLFLFTTALVLGILLITGSIGYRIGASTLRQSGAEKLIQARKAKTRELTQNFQYLNNILLSFSETTAIQKFLENSPKDQSEIRRYLLRNGVEAGWRALIARQDESPQTQNILKSLSQMAPLSIFLQAQFLQEALHENKKPRDIIEPMRSPKLSYFKSHALIHNFVLSLIEKNGLADVILIDPGGNIVYTANKKLNFGANLVNGSFANTRFAQIYAWSSEAPRGTTKFFDFSPIAQLESQTVAFFAAPVYSSAEKQLGTLVFQIPTQKIDDILSNNKDWNSLGLGTSGEVVAFGPEGMMRNTSRYFFENPNRFLTDLRRFHRSSKEDDLIFKSQSTAMILSLSKENLQEYLEMSEIVDTSEDYVGTLSMKSVGKVIFPDETTWIIVAKMSMKEAVAPLKEHAAALLFGLLLILIISFGAAYWISRNLFNPLKKLWLALRALESFSFQKLTVPRKGEFRNISESFNEVSDKFKNLKSHRDFLENMLSSLHETLFIVEYSPPLDEKSSALTLRAANSSAADALGMTPASLKGSELRRWIEMDYSALDEQLRKADATGEFTLEGFLKKNSGGTMPVELSWARVKNESENKIILVAVGRDTGWKKEVTKQLKLKEDLLKESQSLSKTGSFRLDLKTGNGIWSEEEFILFGLDPKKVKPTDNIFRSMIIPEDQPLWDMALKTSRESMQPFDVDLRAKPSGSPEFIWVRCRGRTEYDEYGNPLYIYGTTQDITELRRAEQSLIAAKNEALKSSHAKSEFLARMSHEIRTPMNAIMGMADLLQETKLDADQKYYVKIFVKAGEVLMALINDILDLSKIEAGEVSIENIPFDLGRMMVDVEEMMKPRALEKALSYSFDIAPDVSPYVMGDPTKLRQVLINLVGNSLKFTQQGQIRVSVAKNPSKKDSLLFSVADSGVGIPSSKQHLIFQKFSQADSTVSRKYGGTGLGLAISKSLIELMGGKIWFKSQEGSGSTFFFTVPYREQVYNPTTQKPLPLKGGDLNFTTPKVRDPKKKIRILVADDTEDNRTLFTHYLKNGPYEIIEAENGLEALDKIKSGQFDIVFMDVQMPELDGYAATNEIRKWEDTNHKTHTPIIALTAHALSEDRQKSLRAGCDDHIAKPFKKDTLVGVINKYSL